MLKTVVKLAFLGGLGRTTVVLPNGNAFQDDSGVRICALECRTMILCIFLLCFAGYGFVFSIVFLLVFVCLCFCVCDLVFVVHPMAVFAFELLLALH